MLRVTGSPGNKLCPEFNNGPMYVRKNQNADQMEPKNKKNDSHLALESEQLPERTKDSGIWQWNQLTWTQLSIFSINTEEEGLILEWQSLQGFC